MRAMTRDELASLIARLSAAQIREFEYEAGEFRIRVLFERGRSVIRSCEQGVFHSKHPLTGKACAQVGEVVARGQILAYLSIGTVLRPVIAPLKGRVGKQLLPDGAAAGDRDPLYLFETVGAESLAQGSEPRALDQ
jgi:hypothetical protein